MRKFNVHIIKTAGPVRIERLIFAMAKIMRCFVMAGDKRIVNF